MIRMVDKMNTKVLKTLEYNKIIDMLVRLTSSSMAKSMASSLLPMTDLDDILVAQKQTSDAVARIYQKGSLSFNGIHDIRASIKRLEIGSTLGALELLHISSNLEATLRVKSYGRTDSEEVTTDSLEELFRSLEPLSPINHEIRRCIISEEEIADDASPTLKTIRRSMKMANDKIHETLSSIIGNQNNRIMLQDAIITIRNGRYCIPVRQEYKSKFPGMIHDQSSSGSTFFVEPMSIVKLNNDLKELSIKEQEEIEKILADLSNLCATELPALETNQSVLTTLDFIFAKAQLAKDMKASEPSFNANGIVNIKRGRHPLIPAKKVVPIDVHIGNDFSMLIVTGPNTGGKTVTLKTVGLFTLMGQAGLHIPAFDGSTLSVFEEVYADIGDEQSIEQSLSTFSSHMKNIISIIDKANYRSLVLFDELGAGTDPTEGAALAMSILSDLHRRKITTLATTHYSELKVFALTTEGISNACCEFDVETLRPTYRLLIGIPGKSNAFAISNKLGLPDYIIDHAKERIGQQDQAFEDLISDLNNSKIIIEKEREEIQSYKEEIALLKDKLKAKQARMDESKEKILRQANEEANRILQEAKDFADSSIRKFNKWQTQSGLNKEMEAERQELRNRLNKTGENLSLNQKSRNGKKHTAKDFKLGDTVKVLTLGLNGTISTLPNAKGDCYVQMGILRSQVNIKDLELIDEEVITTPNLTKTQSGKIKMNKSFSIHPEINLIGKTVDEAIPELDKYLDDAYLSHLTKVTVIHGRGTGALMNAVKQHLKKCKYVKSFRLGEFGEGGNGVTVVEFKS